MSGLEKSIGLVKSNKACNLFSLKAFAIAAWGLKFKYFAIIYTFNTSSGLLAINNLYSFNSVKISFVFP